MLKRLFWLGLFCLAFFLLLGLMVQDGDSPLLRRVETQLCSQQAIIPTRQQEDDHAQTVALHHAIQVDQPDNQIVTRAAPLVLRPYYQQNYHAFHYPDKAG